jgi:SPP1 family predicted phage head-tail adaptor
MRAGLLRDRLALQSATETRDGSGAVALSWTTQRTVWGAVEPVSGREEWRGHRILPQTSHMVRIRWPGTGITVGPGWRVLWGSRILNLGTALNVGERDRELQFQATEVL